MKHKLSEVFNVWENSSLLINTYKYFRLNTHLQTGDIVSILASRDSSGRFRINNTQGLLVLRPDHLISSTSVVSGVFCRRKAVLQERWKGIDSASVTVSDIIYYFIKQNS